MKESSSFLIFPDFYPFGYDRGDGVLLGVSGSNNIQEILETSKNSINLVENITVVFN